jgi:hypothetical protein
MLIRAYSRQLFVLCVLFAVANAFGDDDDQSAFKLPGSNFVLPVHPLPSNADPANPASSNDVITQRNNNLRTGTVVQPAMSQASVSDGHFGLMASLPVDGAILAQPLFMNSVQFAEGRRSAIFIATSTNWVYAFNADPPFNKLWERHLADPFRVDDPWNDKNPDPWRQSCLAQTVSTEQDDRSGRQFVTIGIEATPAIDPALNRMIVSYRKASTTSGGQQWIAALDIRTGQVLPGLDRPVADSPIWNKLHRNRASLLIEYGFAYVGFAARCEGNDFGFDKSYQGWIYAFDINTLAFAGRYRTTQNPIGFVPPEPSDDPVDGGGIWQASTGLASDAKGNIYFSTGNGRKGTGLPDPLGKNLSNSVIRLRIDRAASPPQQPARISLTPADWFTPYRKLWQDSIDLDFGSAGVVLIPNTRYLIAGGKEGMLYVLNRNDLGKFDSTPLFDPSTVKGKTSVDATAHDDPSRDRVVQKLNVGANQYCLERKQALFCLGGTPKGQPKHPEASVNGVTMDDWISWPHIHGTPVFGAFPNGRAFLYVWPEKDNLKSFEWLDNQLDFAPTLATGLPSQRERVLAPPYLQDTIGAVGMPGGMLSLTIDPSQPANGVLFGSVQRCRESAGETDRKECSVSLCAAAVKNCQEQRFGMLRAFDPITLRELWNNQLDRFSRNEDKDYWFAKFVPPTIAKGRVYLATESRKVLVYGRR